MKPGVLRHPPHVTMWSRLYLHPDFVYQAPAEGTAYRAPHFPSATGYWLVNAIVVEP